MGYIVLFIFDYFGSQVEAEEEEGVTEEVQNETGPRTNTMEEYKRVMLGGLSVDEETDFNYEESKTQQ